MRKRTRILVLITVNSLFFLWGFLTVLNDILVPYFRQIFSLSYVSVMLLQFCFFTAYGLVSIPSGKVIEKLGYRKSIFIALLTAAFGSFLFLPAAHMPSFALFLVATFVVAMGIVLLQVAANPYVALLGDAANSSSRLNLAQGFNSLGTTLGPLIGSQLILYGKSYGNGIDDIYGAMAVILALLAVFVILSKFPDLQVDQYEEFQEHLSRKAARLPNTPQPEKKQEHHDSIWQFSHLLYGALAVFCYVGAEVSIGSFLVNFLSEPLILGVDHFVAGHYVSLYWGGAMIGRFIGCVILLRFSPRKLLTAAVILASTLLILGIMTSGWISAYSILAIGLCNSIMFPTIFTLGIRGLDNFTAKGSGILCTEIIGGSIITLIHGVCEVQMGIQKA